MSLTGALELFNSETDTYQDERLRHRVRRVLDLQFKGINTGFLLHCSSCKRRETTNDHDPVFLTGLVSTSATPPVVLVRLSHNLAFLCTDCRRATAPAPADGGAGASAPDSGTAATAAAATSAGTKLPPTPAAAAADGLASYPPATAPRARVLTKGIVATATRAMKPPMGTQTRRASVPGPAATSGLSLRSGLVASKGSSREGTAVLATVGQQPDASGKPAASHGAAAAEGTVVEVSSRQLLKTFQRQRLSEIVGGGDGAGKGVDAASTEGTTAAAAAASPGGADAAARGQPVSSGGGMVLREYFEARCGPVKGRTLHAANIDVAYTRHYLLTLLSGGGGAEAVEDAPAAAADGGTGVPHAAVAGDGGGGGMPHLLSNLESAAAAAERYADRLSSSEWDQLCNLDFSVPTAALQTLSHALMMIADWVLAPQSLQFADAAAAAAAAAGAAAGGGGSGMGPSTTHVGGGGGGIGASLRRSSSAAAAAAGAVPMSSLAVAAQLRPWGFAVRHNQTVGTYGNCLRPSLMCLGGRTLGKPPTSLLEVLNTAPLRFSLAREVLARKDRSLGSLIGAVPAMSAGGKFKLRPGFVLPLQRLAALLKRRNKRTKSGPWQLPASQLNARLEELLVGDITYNTHNNQQQQQQGSDGAGSGGAGACAGNGSATVSAPTLSPVDAFLHDLGATRVQVLDALRLEDVDANVGFCVECGEVGTLVVACDSCVDSFCCSCLGGVDPNDLEDKWRCRYCQTLFFTTETRDAGAAARPGTLPSQTPGREDHPRVKQEALASDDAMDTSGTAVPSEDGDGEDGVEVGDEEVEEVVAAAATGTAGTTTGATTAGATARREPHGTPLPNGAEVKGPQPSGGAAMARTPAAAAGGRGTKRSRSMEQEQLPRAATAARLGGPSRSRAQPGAPVRVAAAPASGGPGSVPEKRLAEEEEEEEEGKGGADDTQHALEDEEDEEDVIDAHAGESEDGGRRGRGGVKRRRSAADVAAVDGDGDVDDDPGPQPPRRRRGNGNFVLVSDDSQEPDEGAAWKRGPRQGLDNATKGAAMASGIDISENAATQRNRAMGRDVTEEEDFQSAASEPLGSPQVADGSGGGGGDGGDGSQPFDDSEERVRIPRHHPSTAAVAAGPSDPRVAETQARVVAPAEGAGGATALAAGVAGGDAVRVQEARLPQAEADSSGGNAGDATTAAAAAERAAAPGRGGAFGRRRQDDDFEPSSEGEGDLDDGSSGDDDEEEAEEEEAEEEEAEEEEAEEEEAEEEEAEEEEEEEEEEKLRAPQRKSERRTALAAKRASTAAPEPSSSGHTDTEGAVASTGSGSSSDVSDVQVVGEVINTLPMNASAPPRGRGRGRRARGRGSRQPGRGGRGHGGRSGGASTRSRRGGRGRGDSSSDEEEDLMTVRRGRDVDAEGDGTAKGKRKAPTSAVVAAAPPPLPLSPQGTPRGGPAATPRGRGRRGRPPRTFISPAGGGDLGMPAVSTGSVPMDDTDAAAALMMLNTTGGAGDGGGAKRSVPAPSPAAAAVQQQQQQEANPNATTVQGAGTDAWAASPTMPPPHPGAKMPHNDQQAPPPPPPPAPTAATPVAAAGPAAPDAEAVVGKAHKAPPPAPRPGQVPRGPTQGVPTAAGTVHSAAADTVAIAQPQLGSPPSSSQPQGQGPQRPVAVTAPTGPAADGNTIPLVNPPQPQTAGAAGAAAATPTPGTTAVAAAESRLAAGLFTMGQPLSKKEAIKAGCWVFEYAAERGVEASLLAQWTAALAHVLEWYDTDSELQGTLKACLNGLALSATPAVHLANLEDMVRSLTKLLQNAARDAAAAAAASKPTSS